MFRVMIPGSLLLASAALAGPLPCDPPPVAGGAQPADGATFVGLDTMLGWQVDAPPVVEIDTQNLDLTSTFPSNMGRNARSLAIEMLEETTVSAIAIYGLADAVGEVTLRIRMVDRDERGPLVYTTVANPPLIGTGFIEIPVDFTFQAAQRYDVSFRPTAQWGSPGIVSLQMFGFDNPSLSFEDGYDAGPFRVLDGGSFGQTTGAGGEFGYANTLAPRMRFDTTCGIGYDVYIGTSNPPDTLVCGNVADGTCQPPQLLSNTQYYWQVVGRNCCGETAGPVWSFSTIECPETPEPANPMPANDDVDVPLDTLLTWNNLPLPVIDPAAPALDLHPARRGDQCAVTYDVYFGTQDPPTGLICDDTSLPRCDPPEQLQDGQTYYWQVVANGPDGIRSGPVWSFTTVCDLPSALEGPEPMDLATGIPLEITLRWEDSEPAAVCHDTDDETIASTFETNLGLNARSLAIEVQETTTIHAVGLYGMSDAAGPVTVRIREVIDRDRGEPLASVTHEPVLVGEGFHEVPIDFTFEVGRVYDISFRPEADWGTPGLFSLQMFEFNNPDLDPENGYEVGPFRILDGGTFGQTTGAGGRFSYENPLAPRMLLCVGCGTSYDVYIGTANPPETLLCTNLQQTACTFADLNSNTAYYWQVVARNCCGDTTGPVWSFATIDCPQTPEPNRPAPADGDVDVPLDTVLTWNNLPRPDGDGPGRPAPDIAPLPGEDSCEITFDVYFGTEDPPTTLICADTPATSCAPPQGLIEGRRYYWQVVANGPDATVPGPVWTFSTFCPAPNQPGSPIPADGASAITTSLTLAWDAGGPQTTTCFDSENTAYDVAYRTDLGMNSRSLAFTVREPTNVRGVAIYGISNAPGPMILRIRIVEDLQRGPTIYSVEETPSLVGQGFHEVPIDFTFVPGLIYDVSIRPSAQWGSPGFYSLETYQFDNPDLLPELGYEVGPFQILDGGSFGQTSGAGGSFGYDNAIAPRMRFCVGCTISYDVYIGTGEVPDTLVCADTEFTTCELTDLASNAAYTWQVIARNCCRETSSPVWSFTTGGDLRFAAVMTPWRSDYQRGPLPPDAAECIGTQQNFYVEFWARDDGSENTGVVCAFTDVVLPPGMEAYGTLPSDNFPLFHGGTVDGRFIRDLGGCGVANQDVGVDEWVLVATALCGSGACEPAAQTCLEPAATESAAFGRGAIPTELISYGCDSHCVDAVECPYDLNGDGLIDDADLALFSLCWNCGGGACQADGPCRSADFDCSGTVTSGDLGWFAAGYERTCEDLAPEDYPACRACFGGGAPLQGGPDLVELATDDLGGPLAAGETRTLTVRVRDLTPGGRGLTAAYVDIGFEPELVRIADVQIAGDFDRFVLRASSDSGVMRVGGVTLRPGVAIETWTDVARIEIEALVDLPAGPDVRVEAADLAGFGRGAVERVERIVSREADAVRRR